MKKKLNLSRVLIALVAIPLLSLAVRAAPNSPAAPTTAPVAPRFEKEIEAFEAADKKAPPPRDAVLFIGSSSIRFWKSLADDFAEIPTIRRGFGGSQIADSTRYASRIVIPYQPRLVVIYAGGNDLSAGKSPALVLEDFKGFVDTVHAALPLTRVVYVSVNPSRRRHKQDSKVRELNALVEKLARERPRLSFVDSYHEMLGPDGEPQDALLRDDGLHLSAKGYEKWRAILKPRILKLYQDAARPAPPLP